LLAVAIGLTFLSGERFRQRSQRGLDVNPPIVRIFYDQRLQNMGEKRFPPRAGTSPKLENLDSSPR
jgi:hypothetical protein